LKMKLLKTKLITLLLIFLMLFSIAHAATITSTATGGTWSTGSTWIGNQIPAAGDAVIIATTGTNSVQLTRGITQTAAGSVTVNNGAKLTVNDNRGRTFTFGVLTIINGGSVTISSPLIILGTTNIAGTIAFGSTVRTSRAMAFNGDVTLNAGTIWTEPPSGNGANNTYNFAGNFTNNATTFSAFGTGVHTFSGTGKTMNGTTITSMPNVAITGTRTNSGTLTVSTALSGAGTFTNAATGTLNYAGAGAITPTLAVTATGNTVNYTGAGQTAKVTNYYNLTLSGSGTKTFVTAPTVNGKLSLEGTASVVVTNGTVAYGSSAALQYNKPAAYTATTEEWITPFNASGGVIVTNTGTITVPTAKTIGSASSLNLQNGTLAAGAYITMAPSASINRSEGSMTGTPQGTYNVNYTGNSKSTGPELTGAGLYNFSVNLATSTATLTSSSAAFTVDNNLTVFNGNLILQATDADYVITNDLTVFANGTLTHSVFWNATNKLLRVDGNIAIDGRFAYTVRSHVQMGGVNKAIRTGPAPSSLSILTLAHTSGTISASGLVTVDDNFWASYIAGGGTFATSGNTVFAKSALLNNGGTLLINGGILNVTGGLHSGYQNLNGNVLFSSGTLNSDFVNVGDGTRTGTFTHTGGTANITGSLFIYPACSYSCVNSPAINISGNFTNNGTYSKGTETFTFSGNTSAYISGSSNTVLNNLSVTNSGGVTTQLGLLTTNNLTVASGSKFTILPQKYVTVNGALTLNDSIILKSTSAGTASLLTNGTVTGSKARVERYINGVSWSWHFLSSPVANQAISGDFTPATSGYDFYTWYEPALTWINVKNTSIAPTWNTANGNADFLPVRGYLVAYEVTNTTKNFRGLFNNGTVNYPLTRGGGSTYQYFNLVGNPYPCSIDWEAASGWDRSKLTGTLKSYWIWNDAVGNYGTYITSGSGTNGVTRYIPGGQGFIVFAASEGNLSMNNSVKVHSTKAYLKNDEINSEELRLRLSCNVNSYSDEAIVNYNSYETEDGSEKFNSIYTNAPELWSVKDGRNFSINYLDDLSSDNMVPLTVKAGVAGIYTLTASQTESFGGNAVITLEDRASGTFTNLSNTPDYTFAVNEPSTITNRFYLHLLNVTSVTDTEVAKRFSIYTVNGNIAITSLQQQHGKIAVFDMLGRTIATGRIEAGATSEIEMKGNTGVYIVSVLTSNGISNTKILVN